MWRSVLILLVICLFHLAEAEQLLAFQPATVTLEGKIINSETADPLRDVHVFLAGTKIGTSTDTQGEYLLRDVPAGAYRLIISKVGFGRVAMDTLLTTGGIKVLNFSLKPVTVELDEIIIEQDERWERDLQRFIRLFIGESERADSVVIVNPGVLSFETRWWGRFTAHAQRPLIIENRKLGYRITYYLEEFRHSGSLTRWDGDSLFEEMTPADSIQAALWEQNRKEAFKGSLRHFFLSLTQDRVREEGFIIYRYSRNTRGISLHNRYRTSSERLVSPSDEDEEVYKFNFFGRLEIIYTGAEEDERFIRWTRDRRRVPGRSQTSYLELNERPLTIDQDGEILETYGATRYGYFSFHRIADKTPREYRPQ